VTGLLSGNMPHAVIEEARQQIRLADEYESISDYIETILRFDQKLRTNDLRFSKAQRVGIIELHDLTTQYVESITMAYRERNPASLVKLDALSSQIRKQIKQLRRDHLADLTTESVAPHVTVAFLNALNAYGRIRDHGENIAEVIAGEK
jgi:phosphate:Na+ symporter